MTSAESMKVKKYLKQIESMETNLEMLKSEIEDLKDRAASISAVVTDVERVQTTPTGDVIGNKVAIYVEKEKAYIDEQKAYGELRDKIFMQIKGIEDVRFRKLLYKKYVKHMRFDEIADDMGYVEQYITELHGLALARFYVQYLM